MSFTPVAIANDSNEPVIGLAGIAIAMSFVDGEDVLELLPDDKALPDLPDIDSLLRWIEEAEQQQDPVDASIENLLTLTEVA